MFDKLLQGGSYSRMNDSLAVIHVINSFLPYTLYRLLADDMCLWHSNLVRYIQDIEGEWQYFHCRLSLRYSCRQTRTEITIQILRAGIINHHLSSLLLAPAPGTARQIV